jgi:hypothetical protein
MRVAIKGDNQWTLDDFSVGELQSVVSVLFHLWRRDSLRGLSLTMLMVRLSFCLPRIS